MSTLSSLLERPLLLVTCMLEVKIDKGDTFKEKEESREYNSVV